MSKNSWRTGGGFVDHSTMNRWGVQYRPQLEEAFHRRTRRVWVRWRMDEPYSKVKGAWASLDRAVEPCGKTMDCLLTQQRDTKAARRFLHTALSRNGMPEKITIDGSDAHASALKRSHEDHGTSIAIRQSTYLNNIVAQDHRGRKRVTRAMLELKACDAAQHTLTGTELMRMITKKQMEGDECEGLTAAEEFYAFASSSPHRGVATHPETLSAQNLRQNLFPRATLDDTAFL